MKSDLGKPHIRFHKMAAHLETETGIAVPGVTVFEMADVLSVCGVTSCHVTDDVTSGHVIDDVTSGLQFPSNRCHGNEKGG